MTSAPETSTKHLLPRVETYPQRMSPQLTAFDAGFLSIISFLMPFFTVKKPWGADTPIVRLVKTAMQTLPEDISQCRALLPQIRRRLKKRAGKPSLDDIATLLALLVRFSNETLGQTPYEVQLAAVWSLMSGEIAEMGTGEGKSLTAALTAAALALRGQQVHILTVNDYLSKRDSDRFHVFFAALGISSGCIEENASIEDRRKIYRLDVVFSAAKNIVFDYLRDQTGPTLETLGGINSKVEVFRSQLIQDNLPILQGLDAVIVDEADSVLIDQAATPFILSGGEASLGGLNNDVLIESLELAKDLKADKDYKIYDSLRRAILSENGKYVLEEKRKQQSILSVAPIREHLVCQALVALNLLKKDQDYLIADGKIQIIDESTGRVMPDRQWSDGLHQLVEIKESLEPSEMRTTLGRITFQRFFPRYRHVCGMSGTVKPASRELWESYGLAVRKILPRKKDRRHWDEVNIYASSNDKWMAVADYVFKCYHEGIPILIGTRTVTASRECSASLESMKIPHQVLNAEEVEKEASIVAKAGEPGQVTVATNMAGRGTDIELSPLAVEKGGLHVVLTELHENRRIDLQLAGRCGRQGDPGHVSRFLSLEDGLLTGLSVIQLSFLRFLHSTNLKKCVYFYYLVLQYRQTRRAESARRRLQKYERQREQSLALSGKLE